MDVLRDPWLWVRNCTIVREPDALVLSSRLTKLMIWLTKVVCLGIFAVPITVAMHFAPVQWTGWTISMAVGGGVVVLSLACWCLWWFYRDAEDPKGRRLCVFRPDADGFGPTEIEDGRVISALEYVQFDVREIEGGFTLSLLFAHLEDDPGGDPVPVAHGHISWWTVKKFCRKAGLAYLSRRESATMCLSEL